MNEFFTLNVSFENYHLVFPWAISTILVILLTIMGIQKLTSVLKAHSSNSGKAAERPRWRLLDKGFDARMLVGTLVCIVAYASILDLIGFLAATVLFMVALIFVLRPVFTTRAFLGAGLNAVITPFAIWLIFGQLFEITLP